MTVRALLESGTEPDLKLVGLQIWIHGREFSSSSDFWDGNWLRATAQCSDTGASVVASGAFLRTSELQAWVSDLEALHASMSGEAELATIEPDLKVVLRAGGQGHVEAVVEITPNHLQQEHTFRFALDQSYLPALTFAIRRILKRYPVVGHAP